MIVQPQYETRHVSDFSTDWRFFYESEKSRIDKLNRGFFADIELNEKENAVLVWLCGWDNWTIDAVTSVFRKLIQGNT